MKHTSRLAAAVGALAFSAFPVLLIAPVAAADTTSGATKAGIEHAETLAAADGRGMSKAQIERAERTAGVTRDATTVQPGPVDRSPVSGGDAAGWQLVLSAAFGATLTGGAVLITRQVASRRTAVAV